MTHGQFPMPKNLKKVWYVRTCTLGVWPKKIHNFSKIKPKFRFTHYPKEAIVQNLDSTSMLSC